MRPIKSTLLSAALLAGLLLIMYHSAGMANVPQDVNSPLPVLESGQEVIVSGHGGCTKDELVTVVLTVTQTTSGAVVSYRPRPSLRHCNDIRWHIPDRHLRLVP